MQFRLSNSDIESHAPNTAGVCLIDRSGPGVSHLDLYVGQSENIGSSLSMHYEKTSDQSSCIWKHQPTRHACEMVWWEPARIKRHQQWISKYRPICG